MFHERFRRYMEEGRNAGMWTIGVTRTGNLVGLDEEQWARLPEADKEDRLKAAENVLRAAGADYVVEDIASSN
jgi:phosphonoacetaldehyde hydrolase